jgi:hypothetical protein
MPNGKPGDHPFTDIVHHLRPVYSAAADDLVREIAKLADDKTRRELEDLLMSKYNEYFKPNVPELERILTALRDRLLGEARARGFEPTSMR